MTANVAQLSFSFPSVAELFALHARPDATFTDVRMAAVDLDGGAADRLEAELAADDDFTTWCDERRDASRDALHRGCAVTFAVRQSTPGRPARVVAASADEGVARCAYFVARSTARKGTMTELLEGDETIDAEVSERARPFKATGRPAAARRGQLALLGC